VEKPPLTILGPNGGRGECGGGALTALDGSLLQTMGMEAFQNEDQSPEDEEVVHGKTNRFAASTRRFSKPAKKAKQANTKNFGRKEANSP